MAVPVGATPSAHCSSTPAPSTTRPLASAASAATSPGSCEACTRSMRRSSRSYGSDIEAEVLTDAIPGLNLHRWSPRSSASTPTPGTWYVATQLMLHPIPLDPIPSVITRARLPVAAVMYDVIPYRFPDQYQVEPNARRQAQLARPAGPHGRRDAGDLEVLRDHRRRRTRLSDRAHPQHRCRCRRPVRPAIGPATPTTRHACCPGQVDRYVVSVTGGDERKNTEGLLRAWGLLDPAIRTRPSPRDRRRPTRRPSCGDGRDGPTTPASATRWCSRGASPTTRWSPSCRVPSSR